MSEEGHSAGFRLAPSIVYRLRSTSIRFSMNTGTVSCDLRGSDGTKGITSSHPKLLCPERTSMGTPSTARVVPHLSPSKPPPLKAPANLNVDHVVLGDLLFRTWYPSYYPEELVGKGVDKLYVCQRCFKYSRDVVPFLGHLVGHPVLDSTSKYLTRLLESMLLLHYPCARDSDLLPWRTCYL